MARKSFLEFPRSRTCEVVSDGSALLVCGYCEVGRVEQKLLRRILAALFKSGWTVWIVKWTQQVHMHDTQWYTQSENFAVCYGSMPAKCTIFDAKKCVATYELGAGPHNTIRWNLFGRFIMLAGFGNLPRDEILSSLVRREV